MRVSALPLVVGLFAQWTANNYTPTAKSKKYDSHFVASNHIYPSLKEINTPEVLQVSVFLEKDVYGFKEALAFKESQGRYSIVNTYGYLGKYQFGKSTLEMVGVKDTSCFLNTPALQERAFIANLSRNKWILRKDIKQFSGKYIKGILITESGILAAAHLVGPGSVKKFLRSYGKEAFADAFGTTIEEYLQNFKSFNVSEIKANRKAKAII